MKWNQLNAIPENFKKKKGKRENKMNVSIFQFRIWLIIFYNNWFMLLKSIGNNRSRHGQRKFYKNLALDIPICRVQLKEGKVVQDWGKDSLIVVEGDSEEWNVSEIKWMKQGCTINPRCCWKVKMGTDNWPLELPLWVNCWPGEELY